jgi:hypothetical protein
VPDAVLTVSPAGARRAGPPLKGHFIVTTMDSRDRENALCDWGSRFVRNVFAAAGTLVFVGVAAFSPGFWLPVAGIVRKGAKR